MVVVFLGVIELLDLVLAGLAGEHFVARCLRGRRCFLHRGLLGLEAARARQDCAVGEGEESLRALLCVPRNLWFLNFLTLPQRLGRLI